MRDHLEKRDVRGRARAKALFLPACVKTSVCSQLVLMTDFSPAGAGFRGPIDAQIGDDICYRVADGPGHLGRLAWKQGDRFGVEHVESVEILATLTEPNYRSTRVDVSIPCKVFAKGETIAAKLVNISTGGFALEIDRKLNVGSLISLQIGSALFENITVRWERNGCIGAKFAPRTDLLTIQTVIAGSAPVPVQIVPDRPADRAA